MMIMTMTMDVEPHRDAMRSGCFGDMTVVVVVTAVDVVLIAEVVAVAEVDEVLRITCSTLYFLPVLDVADLKSLLLLLLMTYFRLTDGKEMFFPGRKEGLAFLAAANISSRFSM